MSKRELDIQLRRLSQQIKRCESQISSIEVDFARKIRLAKDVVSDLREMEDKISVSADRYREACEKETKKIEYKLRKEIKEAKESQENSSGVATSIDKVALRKAKTLAIFDSIIFAISNWSTDNQSAPDVELALQSVLFPTVYERVMKGNADYIVENVPPASLEIVKRGRESIRWLRGVTDSSLIDPATWEEHAEIIQQWLMRDALPLIYGARDPEWDDDRPLSLTEVVEWRDMPASRALHFPLIFDGMDLVEKYRDEIREFTGLPEFNKQQVTTRIEP